MREAAGSPAPAAPLQSAPAASQAGVPSAAALVLNPRAGSLASVSRATLEAAIRDAGFTVVATAPEDASIDDQWNAVEASPAGVVFVAGGDGTLRDAARRLIGGPRLLAAIPGGTMNRFCRRLGLPPDPVAAVAAVSGGRPVRLNVGTVNREVFLYQSVVGHVTWLMRLRERTREAGMRGWIPLLRAAVREIVRPGGRTLLVRLGPGRRAQGRAVVVTTPPPEGPHHLSLHLVPGRTAPVRLRQAWRWFRGRLGHDPDVVAREATRFVVAGRDRMVRLSIDGEPHLAATPLRFRLRHEALRALAPRT